MKPAIRTQVDDLGDAYSLATAIDFTDSIDNTRQEFRLEADVNHLLSRYGVGVPMQQQPQFGEVDFDLDLHSAYISVERSQHAFSELPYELRQKYGNVATMLDAMNSGELAKDLLAERAEREKKAAASKAPADPAPNPTPEPSA